MWGPEFLSRQFNGPSEPGMLLTQLVSQHWKSAGTTARSRLGLPAVGGCGWLWFMFIDQGFRSVGCLDLLVAFKWGTLNN